LRAPVLALFVLAQLLGVLPLLYDHTINIYEGSPVASHLHRQAAPDTAHPDADHHHGALDLHDQCCALHTLAGPLPSIVGATFVDFASGRVGPQTSTAVEGESPPLPDRPPRSMSAI
jgi:hypothetical protein